MARFVTNVTKHAVMPACFITNEVVTNHAGITPFFHLDISTSHIVCVCVCMSKRQTEKEREKVQERHTERARVGERTNV